MDPYGRSRFRLSFTLVTLLCGLLGAMLGQAASLTVLQPQGAGLDDAVTCGVCLSFLQRQWILGWTCIGAMQGALLCPAWLLGRGRLSGLRAEAGLLLCCAVASTVTTTLLLWTLFGASAALSLVLARGLLALCLLPLLALVLARRTVAPSLTASGL